MRRGARDKMTTYKIPRIVKQQSDCAYAHSVVSAVNHSSGVPSSSCREPFCASSIKKESVENQSIFVDVFTSATPKKTYHGIGATPNRLTVQRVVPTTVNIVKERYKQRTTNYNYVPQLDCGSRGGTIDMATAKKRAQEKQCYNCGAIVVFERRKAFHSRVGMLVCPECLAEQGHDLVRLSDAASHRAYPGVLGVDYDVLDEDSTTGTGF